MSRPRRLLSESGQALAEYHVLYPGAILLSVMIFVVVGRVTGDLYNGAVGSIVNAFLGNGGLPAETTTGGGEICVEISQITGQAGGSFCEQNDHCDHIEPGEVDGCSDFSYCTILNYADQPEVVVIKAGRDYRIYIDRDGTYVTEDGCYTVTYMNGALSWSKDWEGNDCKNVSHVQAWQDIVVQEDCSAWSGTPPF